MSPVNPQELLEKELIETITTCFPWFFDIHVLREKQYQIQHYLASHS